MQHAVGAAADVPTGISTGVFRTDDGGDSWEVRSKGIAAYEVEAVVVDYEPLDAVVDVERAIDQLDRIFRREQT